MICSCGDASPHEIARRELASGETIVLWSDGDVTWSDVGRSAIRGVGRARSEAVRNRNRRANAAIADVAWLFEASEIAHVIQRARALEARRGAAAIADTYRTSNLLRDLA